MVIRGSPGSIEKFASDSSEAKNKARLLSRKVVKAYVKIAKELRYNGIKLGDNTASETRRGKYDALVAKIEKSKKL